MTRGVDGDDRLKLFLDSMAGAWAFLVGRVILSKNHRTKPNGPRTEDSSASNGFK